jgi:hypothetical protein
MQAVNLKHLVLVLHTGRVPEATGVEMALKRETLGGDRGLTGDVACAHAVIANSQRITVTIRV